MGPSFWCQNPLRPRYQLSNVLWAHKDIHSPVLCWADRPPLRLRCLWSGCSTAALSLCRAVSPVQTEAMACGETSGAARGPVTPAASLASPQLPEHWGAQHNKRGPLNSGCGRVFGSSQPNAFLCQASAAVSEIRLCWAQKPAAVSEVCSHLAESTFRRQ